MKTGKSTIHYHQSAISSQGFTLLEIVIVLGIIAVILGGSIAVVGKMGDSAKLQRVTSDFNTISSAVKMYKLNAGTVPTTSQGLEALVTKPSSTPSQNAGPKSQQKSLSTHGSNPTNTATPVKKTPRISRSTP